MTSTKVLRTLSWGIVLGFFLFTGCDIFHPTDPVIPGQSGSARVSLKLGKVGSLARAIELDTLFISLSAEGETTIEDKIAISGNAQQSETKTYDNLASLKEWTLTAVAKDTHGVVIHSGQTQFTVLPRQTSDVSLSLDAKYSMLKVNFSPIRDSVTACSLTIDDQRVAGEAFPKQSKIGQTVSLEHDYMSASPAPGVSHTIKMDVYGEMWGEEYLLYNGSTTIDVVSGQNASYAITLLWVGPATPPPGAASMTVVLGAIGTVIINGELKNTSGTVTDIDGNVYTTVVIGDQEWTVENLRVTRLNDGTAIPHVTVGTAWSGLSTPGYCFYNNTTNVTDRQKWGALYNWYAVNTGKLAPAGWRAPTDADWTVLGNWLIANGYNWDGTTTGNKIGKSLSAKTDWVYYGTPGAVGNDISSNNRTGFSALPGGYRYVNGAFYYQSSYGNWWSATEIDASGAYYRNLYFGIEVLFRYNYIKGCGFSLRLVRDLN